MKRFWRPALFAWVSILFVVSKSLSAYSLEIWEIKSPHRIHKSGINYELSLPLDLCEKTGIKELYYSDDSEDFIIVTNLFSLRADKATRAFHNCLEASNITHQFQFNINHHGYSLTQILINDTLLRLHYYNQTREGLNRISLRSSLRPIFNSEFEKTLNDNISYCFETLHSLYKIEKSKPRATAYVHNNYLDSNPSHLIFLVTHEIPTTLFIIQISDESYKQISCLLLTTQRQF